MHQLPVRFIDRLFLSLTSVCLFPLIGSSSRAQMPPLPPPVAVASEKSAKTISMGTFTDKANNKHDWQINAAHALVWDNTPYLPVGGSFTPHSFTNDADAAWQSDVKALETLKAKGLQDVLISPDRSLPDVPIKSLQRLLDYLDANGFHYGVAFGKGMTDPLAGNVVKPTVYRMDIRPDVNKDALLTAEWIVPNTDHAAVFMYDGINESKLFREPWEIPVRETIVSVPVEAPPAIAHPYVLLLPHKTVPASEQGSMPDVWNGFDSYRDRVLAYFAQIKFGPGMRFFLDPLAHHVGVSGEAMYLVPDSVQFKLQWEGFLTRKYGSPEELRDRWSLMDRFTSFSELARLVPLWAYSRGCPYFYDPLTHRAFRMLQGNNGGLTSQWWNDFQLFREASLTYSMNTLADVLKKQVANVPVVYTWTQSASFFSNENRDGGFDGLAVCVRALEPSRLSRTLGPAYGNAEQGARSSWLIAGEIDGVSAPTPMPKVSTASLTNATSALPAGENIYQNRLALAHDFEDIRRLGVKGFFVNSLQSGPVALDAPPDAAWLSNPEGLGWLADYAGSLKSEANRANLRPRVLFYPQSSPGPAHTGLIQGTAGVYWLPSGFYGEPVDLWPSYTGYNIRRSEADPLCTVLVSLIGQRKTHFMVQNPARIRAYNAEGQPVSVKMVSKNMVEIVLDTTPTILQFDGGEPPVPAEAAEDVLIQLDALYEIATLLKVIAADNSRLALDQSKDYLSQRNYAQSYAIGRAQLDVLVNDASPYIWLEGEQDIAPLFNEVAGHPEASNGAYRRLATPNRPNPVYGYKARYEFTTNHAGVYQVWIAGTLPGPTTSPIKWNVNGEQDRDISDPKPHGPTYMNDRFGWMLLGTAKLGRGLQKLTIDVTDPAVANHEYTYAIDALVLTDKGFTPNGTIRPLPVDGVTLRDVKKDRRVLKSDKPHIIP